MNITKKQIRDMFRKAVFHRDNNCCRVCGLKTSLDAHHIINRNLLPSGGYVLSNGISLCPDCHIKAEVFHSTGTALEGWHPNDLYKLIKSSENKARQESNELAAKLNVLMHNRK